MVDPLSRPARPREPILNLPTPVTVLLLVLLMVHAVRELTLAPATDLRVLLDLAFVPARWTLWWDPSSAQAVLNQAGTAGSGDLGGALARLAVEEGGLARPWTALTYAFLHGSWLHVILNGVWIAAFGSPVARRIGGARFLGLAAVAAIAGAAAHLAAYRYSAAPLIGASAAGAGLMGASVRFVFAAPELQSMRDGVVLRQPALSLPRLLVERRALLFVGVWLVTNFLFGIGAGPVGITDANVAWEAHVGGFAAGLLLFPAFDPRPSPPEVA